MEQQNLNEEAINWAKIQMQEMEHVIELLQKENAGQKKMIIALQKENELLRKHADDYANIARQMLNELHP